MDRQLFGEKKPRRQKNIFEDIFVSLPCVLIKLLENVRKHKFLICNRHRFDEEGARLEICKSFQNRSYAKRQGGCEARWQDVFVKNSQKSVFLLNNRNITFTVEKSSQEITATIFKKLPDRKRIT
jgi:hypothetical protein